jgi:hypothetical protein
MNDATTKLKEDKVIGAVLNQVKIANAKAFTK